MAKRPDAKKLTSDFRRTDLIRKRLLNFINQSFSIKCSGYLNYTLNNIIKNIQNMHPSVRESYVTVMWLGEKYGERIMIRRVPHSFRNSLSLI